MAAIGYAGEWRGKASTFPAVVRDYATVSEFARVQAGVDRPTEVRENAFIMAGAHIGHDAIIGEHADICPNVVICGGASIGDHCKIYSGAVVSPGVIVHDRAIIAANSVVTRDVPPDQVWGGTPARYIRDREAAS
jgi:acetyltransferase-like isoleucine patch superfamily enzyme